MVFANTVKIFKIPVFGGSKMYLVKFGLVKMILEKIWKNLICIKSFFIYLVKFVFVISFAFVFVAIQRILFGLKLKRIRHFSAYYSYFWILYT